jgi:hypothetical protein
MLPTARLKLIASLATVPDGALDATARLWAQRIGERAALVRKKDGSPSRLVPALLSGDGPDPQWRLVPAPPDTVRLTLSTWVADVARVALEPTPQDRADYARTLTAPWRGDQ